MRSTCDGVCGRGFADESCHLVGYQLVVPGQAAALVAHGRVPNHLQVVGVQKLQQGQSSGRTHTVHLTLHPAKPEIATQWGTMCDAVGSQNDFQGPTHCITGWVAQATCVRPGG